VRYLPSSPFSWSLALCLLGAACGGTSSSNVDSGADSSLADGAGDAVLDSAPADDSALDSSESGPACTVSGPGRFLPGKTGVLGRYYAGAGFTGTPFALVVANASSDWEFGSPDSIELKGIDSSLIFTSDHFSVQYDGAIVAPAAGTYTLSVATNPSITTEVVALTVDGAPFTLGTSLTLDPAKPAPFSLRYDHPKPGRSWVHLQWTGPGITTAVDIPSANLLADVRALDQSSKAFAGMPDGSMPIGVFWPNQNTFSDKSTKIPSAARRSDGHTGWVERGANLFVFDNQWGDGGDLSAGIALATALGVRTWRFPADVLTNTPNPGKASPTAFDTADTTLTAYALEDEAYLKISTADFLAEASHARATRPLPIYCNFAGSSVAGNHPQVDIDGARAFMGSCDWLAMDNYPLTQPTAALPNAIALGIDVMAQSLQRLIEYSGGKPVFSYVDTADEKLAAGSRGPSAKEVDAMVFGALIAGARSILYFPEVPGTGANDGTPTDVEAELPRLNSLLQKWASVLLDEGTSISNLALPDHFRAAVRVHGGKTYAFVFNNADAPADYHPSAGDPFAFYGVSGPPDGTTFAPYQLMIVHDCVREVVTVPLK
jgi:hypothetical protein